MGVTGLWSVVQPCARPIKIETLNKKRLAVDASIWVYQFLKAVRDKEGNALRNSHVVGFFRRICKLLFFGIKPVFVFDGGAPVLKRQTISGRKSRREGRREDAVRTAGKLLALQMQRRAEEEQQRQRDGLAAPAPDPEEPLPDNLVYVDELAMTQTERQQNRSFRKTDQYHLPQLSVPLAEMGGPNDPRVMSMEELEQYARQFETGEDINVYDFSKIDFDSPFFTSLPAADRYNILNAARMRSRLRMGLSKEQLDSMFPNRMDFSRFQIERVRERNELTSRLMNINGAGDGDWDASGRVAGEKGREYVLVKNPGVEGGWALGVVGERDKEEGQQSKPIDVETELTSKQEPADADEPDTASEDDDRQDVERRRKVFYESRQKLASLGTAPKPDRAQDPDAIFVDEETHAPAQDGGEDDDEEAELQRAIAMSLEATDQNAERESSPDEDDYEAVFNPRNFHQEKAKEYNPFSKQSLGHVAQVANNRARRTVPKPVPQGASSDDEALDLHAALAESRRSKRKTSPGPSARKEFQPGKPFDGPLPFEKLDLGASLLGRKKTKETREAAAGGFEQDETTEAGKEDEAAPPPPWFTGGDLEEGLALGRKREQAESRREQEAAQDEFEFERATLRKHASNDVIDVDAYDKQRKQAIFLESSDEEGESRSAAGIDSEGQDGSADPAAVDDSLRMGDVADKFRAEPPALSDTAGGSQADSDGPKERRMSPEETIEWEESDHEGQRVSKSVPMATAQDARSATGSPDVYLPPGLAEHASREESPDVYIPDHLLQQEGDSRTQSQAPRAERSPSSDVYIPEGLDENADPSRFASVRFDNDESGPIPASGSANQTALPEDDYGGPEDDEIYSDLEEEELMIAMANEAEEHARFASQLNNKSYEHNAEEYERELKALRTQQSKDRRDADEVTQVMITECQQLLKLFGLPYITAPMEAEAQCAELVRLGLVDGIVTDDSDTFLFGGTRVYKNMFNQAKFVECYLAADLEKEFDLTRDKLIGIAHLLGSDYTEGLPGIGPVNALEIIGEFPDLDQFREWWSKVQSTMTPADFDEDSAFRKKFRKSNITKLFLPSIFPDVRVRDAYLQPEVDSDPSPFQWGVPDLDALRSFFMATIGWGPERTDEVLLPVIRDMNRREAEGTQANITNFVTGGTGAGAFNPRVRSQGKGKRMEGALSRMAEKARHRRLHAGEAVDVDTVAGDDAVIAVSGTAAARPEAEAGRTRAPAAKHPGRAARKRGPKSAPDKDDDDDDDEADDAYGPPTKRKKGAKAAAAARRNEAGG